MAKGKSFTFYEHDQASANSVANTLKGLGMKNVKVSAEIGQGTRHPTGRFAIEHFDPNYDNRHRYGRRRK